MTESWFEQASQRLFMVPFLLVPFLLVPFLLVPILPGASRFEMNGLLVGLLITDHDVRQGQNSSKAFSL